VCLCVSLCVVSHCDIRCGKCNQLDFIVEDVRTGSEVAHGTSKWVTPCHCPVFVHRHCLELTLVEWEGLCCSVCGVRYRVGARLPHTMREIVAETLRAFPTWRWSAFLLLLKTAVLLAIASAVEACPLQGLSIQFQPLALPGWPVILFLFQLISLWTMFRSPRFRRVHSRLYFRRHNNSLYDFYIRVYLFFTWSSLTLNFQFIKLPFWRQSWLTLWRTSVAWQLLAWLNLTAFTVAASAVLVTFWRTRFRVTTPLPNNPVEQADHSSCLTCGLELCHINH